jgi:hypothetical protein
MYEKEKPHTKKNEHRREWVNREKIYLLRPDEHAEIKIN